MTSKFARTLATSFAIAAALAMPTAVKAQSSNVETAASATNTYADELSSEYEYDENCIIYIPGIGCIY
ncbi:MAG: hypothetical protein AAF703_12740 [Cyanobacteria bacterium P01_D01_bin.105]